MTDQYLSPCAFQSANEGSAVIICPRCGRNCVGTKEKKIEDIARTEVVCSSCEELLAHRLGNITVWLPNTHFSKRF